MKQYFENKVPGDGKSYSSWKSQCELEQKHRQATIDLAMFLWAREYILNDPFSKKTNAEKEQERRNTWTD